MKFALNSSTDTFLHYANLALWRKGDQISAACKLCGERQIPCHILIITEEHLSYIGTMPDMTRSCRPSPNSWVGGCSSCGGSGTAIQLPTSLAFTDLWPDLVAYSCLAKMAINIELIICFEINFLDVKQRKVATYSEVVEEIEERDFVVDLITLEVGSIGFMSYDGFCWPRDSVGASQKELNELLHSTSLATIKGSFQIRMCRNHVN